MVVVVEGGGGDAGNVGSGRGLDGKRDDECDDQGLWDSGYCCQWVVYRNELVRCTRPLWGQLCGEKKRNGVGTTGNANPALAFFGSAIANEKE